MIDLSQIAEELIASMYNESPSVREFFTKQFKKAISFKVETIAVPNLPLSSNAKFRFDGAHKIDIAILDKTSHCCVPCEAKLGNNRLGKRDFESRFLKPCCETRHKDPRIGGNMISIFEGYLPKQYSDVPISVNHEGINYNITPFWILIMRRAIYDSWERNGTPSLSSNCIKVSFESIVQAYGNKLLFNSLVREMLCFDYYDKWIS